jgi:hypothetical protein
MSKSTRSVCDGESCCSLVIFEVILAVMRPGSQRGSPFVKTHTAGRRADRGSGTLYTRSITIEIPWPTPMHMVQSA